MRWENSVDIILHCWSIRELVTWLAAMRSTFIILATMLALAIPTPAQARWYRCRHEVLPGESLSAIAKRYHVSIKRLRAINKIKRDWIRAGKKIGIVSRFPCRTRTKIKYKVRRKDTLSRIARKYKLPARLLRRLNPRARKGLKVGQYIWVVVEGPRPKDGVKGMYQLHTGAGYVVRNSGRAWGTFLAVTRLVEVLSAHQLKYPKGAPIRVDDLSRKGGGYLRPHLSHRTGRDVDIRYPLTIKTSGYIRANARTLDVPRAWALIHAFLKTKDVVYVFVEYKLQKVLYQRAQQLKVPKDKLKKWFQYPRSKRSMTGIIRHEPGHDTHLHVRFRKSDPEEEPNS